MLEAPRFPAGIPRFSLLDRNSPRRYPKCIPGAPHAAPTRMYFEKEEVNAMNHAEKARANFLEGYNCAQSVLLAFADDLGLEQETAARLASSFGGGMGRLREVCGALSASFLILGLRQGYSSPTDDEAKARQYAQVQEIAAQFRAIHGTILCRELLGLAEGPDVPTPSKRTTEYYESRPCERCIGDAAAIVERMLFSGEDAV